jgi:hypothetical protein
LQVSDRNFKPGCHIIHFYLRVLSVNERLWYDSLPDSVVSVVFILTIFLSDRIKSNARTLSRRGSRADLQLTVFIIQKKLCR